MSENSKQLKPLIFIPGLKGSVLADERGKVWISLKNVLMSNHYNVNERMKLPKVWDEDGTQAQSNAVPTKVLKSIGPVDVYGKFIKKGKSKGYKIFPFHYDW